jgi:hypothetical protein
MKQYGRNAATEFTRKQINVIFALTKQGTLTVTKEVMGDFYELADFYGEVAGYDDLKAYVERCESKILTILDAVFSKNYELAQEHINEYAKIAL